MVQIHRFNQCFAPLLIVMAFVISTKTENGSLDLHKTSCWGYHSLCSFGVKIALILKQFKVRGSNGHSVKRLLWPHLQLTAEVFLFVSELLFGLLPELQGLRQIRGQTPEHER